MKRILKGVGVALMVLTWPLWFFPLLGWVLFLLMLDSIREARFRRLLCLPLLAALLLTGCVSLSVPLPDGRVARYTRVGSTSLEGLVVTHGDTRVEVRGYQSEGAGLVEAATRGAVQGAVGLPGIGG